MKTMNHVDANYRGERTFLKGKKQKHRPGMSMHSTLPYGLGKQTETK